jgi:S1-C subfamily serine protease
MRDVSCHSDGALATEESGFKKNLSPNLKNPSPSPSPEYRGGGFGIPRSASLPQDDLLFRALLTILLLLVGWNAAFAQDDDDSDSERSRYNYPQDRITVPSWRFAHGPHVRAAFRDVVASVRPSVVEVLVDGSKVGLGGVVGENGFVLTKASSLIGKVSCRLSDGRELPATIKGADREFDLAVLKIAADDLPPLEISESTVPIVGSWLATVGMDSYPAAIGVVSVEPREIPHQAGILGVQLGESNNEARIVRVFPASAAAKAGLLVNDVILEIEGAKTPTREALVKRVQEFSPGDTVQILIKRGEEEIKLSAILMGRFPGLRPSRSEFQNLLGSGLSERRFGFAKAFQHDTVFEPTDVGGPVVNLDGKVVGFNIARSGRTESYAIATDSLAKIVKALVPKSDIVTESDTASEVPLVPRVPVTVP